MPETRLSLLNRLQNAQDDQAWQRFTEIYTPLILRYCQLRGLQETDAVDVAQEVVLTVSRRIGRFEYRGHRGAFRSWLFKITRSRFNDFLDDRRRQPQVVGGSSQGSLLEAQACPEHDDVWEREYKRWLFDWACKQVRTEFEDLTWQAFWKMAVDNQPGNAVAQTLGLSLGAVYIAKSRVLARLKQTVEEVSDESALLAKL